MHFSLLHILREKFITADCILIFLASSISVSDVKFDFTSEDMGKGVNDAAEAANAGGAASLNNNNNMPVIRKKASSHSHNTVQPG